MRIEQAKYECGFLQLEVKQCPEVMRFCFGFKPDDYEIKKKRKQRSKEANAYAWVLIDKLAQALNLSKTEVYRREIKDIGGVSEIISMPTAAIPRFKTTWERNGIGWQIDVMPSETPEYSNVVVYYGSSMYDTKQMSTLIDRLVEDCRACGIETLPPWKLDLMKGEIS